MFSSSLAFRKIKPNVYAFIPGNVYTAKAYFVNYVEKKALEDVIDLFTSRSVSCTTSCPLIMKIVPVIGIPLFVILFFWGYYKYRQGVKKIIGVREKHPIKRQTFIGRLKQIEITYSWKDIRMLGLVNLVILLVLIFSFIHFHTAKYIYVFIILGAILLLYLIFFSISLTIFKYTSMRSNRL